MSRIRPFGAVPGENTAARIHRNNADLGIGEAPPPPPRTSRPRRRRRDWWIGPAPTNDPPSNLDRLDGLR